MSPAHIDIPAPQWATWTNFGSEITDQTFFPATGESLAHIHYALDQGLLTEHEDSDGVAWFTRA